MTAKRGLGKGLDALFESMNGDAAEKGEDASRIREIRIMDIDPNPMQPRKEFKDEKINELAESIRVHGLVQPIVVKPIGKRYLLVAGERRWRASRIAGMTKIPAVVLDLNERQVMEIGLIENLQREDLNPIEEAKGIKQLMDEYKLTQEEIAAHLGKSRPAITNTVRLLNLSDFIQGLLTEGKLSAGHARTLLGIEDPAIRDKIALTIAEKGLNVRDTEKLIKSMQKKSQGSTSKAAQKPGYITEIEAGLEESLGTRVEITTGKKKGIIHIEYYSNEDLERIIEKVSGKHII